MTAGELKMKTLYPKMWRRERSLGTGDLKCSGGSGPQAKPYFGEKMRTIIVERSRRLCGEHTPGCQSVAGWDPWRREDSDC